MGVGVRDVGGLMRCAVGVDYVFQHGNASSLD